MSIEQFVLDHMIYAQQVGKKYSFKNNRFEPECIAEAYYQLCDFANTKMILFETAENKIGYLKITISRALGRYFSKYKREENIGDYWLESGRNEQKLYDLLEQLCPECDELFSFIRDGFALDDLMFWRKQFKKKIGKIKRIRRKILKHVKTIDEMGQETILSLPEAA